MEQTNLLFVCLGCLAGVSLLVLAGFLAARNWRKKRGSLAMDEMEGHDFE